MLPPLTDNPVTTIFDFVHDQRTWRRNSFSAGSCGLSRSSAGGPISVICPLERKAIRCEISRANLSSCVTMTIIIRSRTSERMTSRTSPTSSGSSAEVISHLRAETDPFQQTLREILDFGRRSLMRERRTKTDVLHGGHVRKEIELLEHDPHLLPQRSNSRPRHPGSDPADPCPVPEGIPVQPDLSGVVLLEEVDAPEKGGLP